ncbi:hypothetical protein KY285_009625 [Solanum tuberosum]|nr:hypothetical protein KY285_009625 [Solanum tuberosum]
MSRASSSNICKYDVFLSFRGEDTRRNFVSHLYNALDLRGIRTFKDDKRLEIGKSISDEFESHTRGQIRCRNIFKKLCILKMMLRGACTYHKMQE